MVATNVFTPRKAYSTAPSVLSSRSFRLCTSDYPTTAFLSDANKVAKQTDSPKKEGKYRKRAKPLSCGLVSNLLNIFTFSGSVILILSSFIKLHNDSDVELLDLSWLMPHLIFDFAVSGYAYSLPATCFFAHILSMRVMKTRRTFPDLIATILWLILFGLKLKRVTKDVMVYQLGFSAILSIIAFAVTFFPRKRLHRKKPNSIFQSAFSVASTPLSQCSASTARSTPNRLFSAQKDVDFMDQNDDETLSIQRRLRNFSPSRELSSLFGGLTLGKRTPDGIDNVRHRGPFASMKKPILTPSRFTAESETSGTEVPYSTCYAASTVPSLMTSISQTAAQPTFSLVNVICFSVLSVSVCLNFALLYYLLYMKCP